MVRNTKQELAAAGASPRFGIRQTLFLVVAGLAGTVILLVMFSLASLHSLERKFDELKNMPALSRAQRIVDELGFLVAHIQTLPQVGNPDLRERWIGIANRYQRGTEENLAYLTKAVTGIDTAGTAAGMLSRDLAALDQARRALDLAVAARVAAANAREAQETTIESLQDKLLDSIEAMEANIRAQSLRMLYVLFDEFRTQGGTEERVDLFIEREMGWLATAFRLRSYAADLVGAVRLGRAAAEPAVLESIRQQARLPALRLGLVRRLPPSTTQADVSAATAGLTAAILDPDQYLDLRKQELLARKLETAEAAAVLQAALRSQRSSLELVHALDGYGRSVMVETQTSIRRAQQGLAFLLLAGAVILLIVVRRYLLERIAWRLEGLTGCMLTVSAEGVRAQ